MCGARARHRDQLLVPVLEAAALGLQRLESGPDNLREADLACGCIVVLATRLSLRTCIALPANEGICAQKLSVHQLVEQQIQTCLHRRVLGESAVDLPQAWHARAVGEKIDAAMPKRLARAVH